MLPKSIGTTRLIKPFSKTGVELSFIWFSIILSHKQRLRPLGYCAALECLSLLGRTEAVVLLLLVVEHVVRGPEPDGLDLVGPVEDLFTVGADPNA